MKLYGIYGSSGFGREVMPLARMKFIECIDYELVFIDDSASDESDGSVNGHRVLTWNKFVAAPAMQKSVAIAIANSKVRERLAGLCSSIQIDSISIQASNVIVMDDVEIGEGALLSPFVTITSNVTIGRYFHANIYSYVAHDCVIGDFVTFAPSVHCNGNVVIEDYAYIGAGAIIKQGVPGAPLVIGQGAVIGMGAVVTKSVAPGTTVVGNPARPLVKG